MVRSCVARSLLAAQLAAPGAVATVRPDRVLRRALEAVRRSTVITLPGRRGPLPALGPPSAAPNRQPVTPRYARDPPDRRRRSPPAPPPRPKPVFPAEFERDSAVFCQKLIAHVDASPTPTISSAILSASALAMDDEDKRKRPHLCLLRPHRPLSRNRAGFCQDTGLLRTVFVYPWKMTWNDCRSRGAPMSSPRRRTKGESSTPI